MGIRVIVADAFPLLRDAIARALDCDPEIEVVAEAATGPATLSATLELEPDVLVLDLLLPVMDGIAVISRVRAELPSIKTVVLTGSDQLPPLLDAVAAGADAYLYQSATSTEVRHAVHVAHAGGSVIDPTMASYLLQQFSDRARDGDDDGDGEDGSRVRPLLLERELEILRMVAEGKTDKEISAALYVSPRTVQNHLARLRRRTGLRRRAELTRWAVEHALV